MYSLSPTFQQKVLIFFVLFIFFSVHIYRPWGGSVAGVLRQVMCDELAMNHNFRGNKGNMAFFTLSLKDAVVHRC
jgi:hypothetical protein